jgi:hypothetical protein
VRQLCAAFKPGEPIKSGEPIELDDGRIPVPIG